MSPLLRRLPVLLLLLSLGASAVAATVPLLGAAKPADTAATTIGPPNPAALGADWWSYFEIDAEALPERIDALLAALDVDLEEVPEATAQAAQPLRSRVDAGLRALAQMRAQPLPEAPAPAPHAEGYTTERLLELAGRLRVARNEMETARDEAASMERAVQQGSKRMDTLFAAYLEMAADDPQRWERGLEVVAERVALAAAAERLRHDKAALEAREALVAQLSAEQEVAAERLLARPIDRQNVGVGLQDAEQRQAEAAERVVREEEAVLAPLADDEEGRATGRYRRQRVVRANVQHGLETVRVMHYRAERALLSLVALGDRADIQALRGELGAGRQALGKLLEQSRQWLRDSERERSRASERLAGQGEAAALGFMQLLTQDRLKIAQESLTLLQRLNDAVADVRLLHELTDQRLAREEGLVRHLYQRASSGVGQVGGRALEWASTSLFKIGDTPVTPLGLIRVVLIVLLAWVVSFLLRRALKQISERREGVNQSALYTVARLSHYSIMLIGFLVGLASIGIDFTTFALVAGALSIGIGFGLQSIVSNFVSGLIILFERSLKVGDFVELDSGVAGQVTEINVRSTVINTNDNTDIVVPNSEFVNSRVTNWTLREDYRRMHIPFGVAYGTDKDLVKRAVLEAAADVPYTLLGMKGRNHDVWLVGFGDSSLNFELVVWVTARAVKRPGTVRAAYLWAIETALDKAGIEIPFPQRDLRLRSGFEVLAPARAEASGG